MLTRGLITFLFSLVFISQAVASAVTFSFHGRAFDEATENPISGTADFFIELVGRDSQCVLFSEVHKNVSLTDLGVFAVEVGLSKKDPSSSVFPNEKDSGLNMSDAFGYIYSNALKNCGSDVPAQEGRDLIVKIQNSNMSLSLDPQPILTTPTSAVAFSLNGYTERHFIHVNEIVTQQALEDLITSGGVTGPKGERGLSGEQGPAGPQGPKGAKGDKGATGPQGPKGVKGDKGAAGPQGPKGVKGDKGATGPQGPKGVKGDRGATGPQGPKGVKGDKGATGPQGPKGVKGDKGATGPQGPKGVKGDKGATGPQGPKGAKGDKGATGPQGPKGASGDKGATGPQGVKGATGDKGATGPQGPKGDKGDKGDKGAIASFMCPAGHFLRGIDSKGQPLCESVCNPDLIGDDAYQNCRQDTFWVQRKVELVKKTITTGGGRDVTEVQEYYLPEGETHTEACARKNAVPVLKSPHGICASGEARLTTGTKYQDIKYSFGTWGGVLGGGALASGEYCYHHGQKADGDRTDITVAFLCAKQ